MPTLMQSLIPLKPIAAIVLVGLSLGACTSSFTGPIEITRFAAPQTDALGQGTITLEFPEEMDNERARNAVAAAVADELSALGYQVVLDGTAEPQQIALVRTSRNPLASPNSGGPVRVGVGGGTGSYGSGVGVGLGLSLGGNSGPRVMTDLSVRISGPDGASLWEGRAQQPVSINSPYADVDASARALASALFKDFPGGNGETVTIDVDEL